MEVHFAITEEIMSAIETAAISNSLSTRQLNLIARRYGAFAKKPFLDIGCGDGTWTAAMTARHSTIAGWTDQEFSAENIEVGSPAANTPFETQSIQTALIRGTAAFAPEANATETTIALANVCSCMKPRGYILIPITSATDESLWQSRFEPFPGRLSIRELSGGIMDLLTLAKLFGRDHSAHVIEFQLDRKPISRLEWHRFAHQAVTQRQQANPAA